jgi:hypothetical protein
LLHCELHIRNPANSGLNNTAHLNDFPNAALDVDLSLVIDVDALDARDDAPTPYITASAHATPIATFHTHDGARSCDRASPSNSARSSLAFIALDACARRMRARMTSARRARNGSETE